MYLRCLEKELYGKTRCYLGSLWETRRLSATVVNLTTKPGSQLQKEKKKNLNRFESEEYKVENGEDKRSKRWKGLKGLNKD